MTKKSEPRLDVTASYEGVSREFINNTGVDYLTLEVVFATQIIGDMKLLLCDKLAVSFARMMSSLREKDYADVKGKQRIARGINRTVDSYGLTLIHPETQEECVLFAISDHLGGKWTLESRATKRRSMTTRLPAKVPFNLRPLPLPPPEWLDYPPL